MQSPEKLITVIIPTYNRSRLLDYTLSSIRSQTIDKSILQVIVADDGSSDDTRAVAESYRAHFTTDYFFQEDKGYRVASARNMGIENATGQIVVFIDSGVVLTPGCLKAHLDAHTASPSDLAVIGYVFAIEHDHVNHDFLIRHIDISEPGKTTAFFQEKEAYLDIREEIYKICDNQLDQLPAPWVLFWTGNVSVKRTNLLQAGLFDSNFDCRWGMEDIDLGYRLFKNGLKFALVREAQSIHYPHTTDHEEKMEQEYPNKLYFHNKHQSHESKTLLDCTTVELNKRLHYITSSLNTSDSIQ